MKRTRSVSEPDLNVLVDCARDAIVRAKASSIKTSVLYVSPDFVCQFVNKNGITPIMICGLFYEVDENMDGIACYVVEVR